MKFCPQCGAQNDDENSFCYMCGAPFSGEPKQEEQKTDPQTEQKFEQDTGPRTEQPYSAPAAVQSVPSRKRVSSGVLYGAIAIVVVAIVLIAVMLPSLMVPESNNEVTITIDSVSIKDDAKQFKTDDQGRVTYYVTIECSNGTETKSMTFKSTSESYKCKTDGTATEPKVSQFITMTGDTNSYKYSVFLMVDTGKINDYVDIYTEENIDGTKPSYVGYSGVWFTGSEIKDNKVTLTGDSDPVGSLTLSFNIVKK